MFLRNMLVRDVPVCAPSDATQSIDGRWMTDRPATAPPYGRQEDLLAANSLALLVHVLRRSELAHL